MVHANQIVVVHSNLTLIINHGQKINLHVIELFIVIKNQMKKELQDANSLHLTFLADKENVVQDIILEKY